jgi:hypothetical protein
MVQVVANMRTGRASRAFVVKARARLMQLEPRVLPSRGTGRQKLRQDVQNEERKNAR